VNKLYVLSDNQKVYSASLQMIMRNKNETVEGKDLPNFKFHVVDIWQVYSSTYVTDITADKYGNVYIADYSKEEILLVTPQDD